MSFVHGHGLAAQVARILTESTCEDCRFVGTLVEGLIAENERLHSMLGPGPWGSLSESANYMARSIAGAAPQCASTARDLGHLVALLEQRVVMLTERHAVPTLFLCGKCGADVQGAK